MRSLGLRGDHLARHRARVREISVRFPVVIQSSSAGQFEGKKAVGESLVCASVSQREQAFGLIRGVWPGQGFTSELWHVKIPRFIRLGCLGKVGDSGAKELLDALGIGGS